MQNLPENILLDLANEEIAAHAFNVLILQNLYTTVDETGDVLLVPEDESQMEVDSAASEQPLLCHSQVLQAFSPFVSGLLNFDDVNLYQAED